MHFRTALRARGLPERLKLNGNAERLRGKRRSIEQSYPGKTRGQAVHGLATLITAHPRPPVQSGHVRSSDDAAYAHEI